ncbi:MAG: hypothetical protein H6R19_391 [Proteobacteria bacterium]|nr:hypothetical protein [Pseudomonadota bacterium]
MGPRAQPRQVCQVTCVLPGLTWPGHGITAALGELKLPGLAALLGRGQRLQQAGIPLMSWLAAQFGAQDPSWGALRAAGEADFPAVPANASILCADPVSLAFSRDALLLRGPDELALQADEVAALIASLNTEFAELGQFHAVDPQRWYLLARAQVAARFHPLGDVRGRPVSLFPPEGEAASEWNRIANAIQILLYNHPVNQARSERGQLGANGLWFWGQAGTQNSALHAPARRIVSEDPLVRGLAAAAGAQALTPGTAGTPAQGVSGHTWWVDLRLQEAALAGDFTGWLRALQSLDTELIQPLYTAWQRRRIHALTLLAPSDKCLLSAALTARTRYSFWRQPLTQNLLTPYLQAAPLNSPETTR